MQTQLDSQANEVLREKKAYVFSQVIKGEEED